MTLHLPKETLSSLRVAASVKNIKTRPVLGSFIGAVATISVEPPMISTVSEARDLRTFPSRLTTFPSRLIAFPSRLT